MMRLMRSGALIIIVAALSSSAFGFFHVYALGSAIVTFSTTQGPVHVNAEVAETPLEKQRGLMFRAFLPEDAGMLFVFEDDRRLTFWMMNTSIPLDGIFISSELRVVFVAENLTPCPPPDCLNPERFSSPTPAKYVLEVNAGFSRSHGIVAGTDVSIESSTERQQADYMQPPGILTVSVILVAIAAILIYRWRRKKGTASASPSVNSRRGGWLLIPIS